MALQRKSGGPPKCLEENLRASATETADEVNGHPVVSDRLQASC